MGTRIAPAVAAALDAFAAAVRARFGGRVRELVLFGSHARGDAHEESDVDVLVVVEGLTEPERHVVIEAAYRVDLASEDAVCLSALALSAEQAASRRSTGRRIWSDIAREGIPL